MQEATTELAPLSAPVKQCRRCKRTKPVIAFYADRTQGDGLQKYCICCRREQKGIFARMKEKAEAQRSKLEEAERRRADIIAKRDAMEQARESRKEILIQRRREQEAKRRRENPDSFKAKSKRWRDKNVERARAITKAWAKENPDCIRRKNARYREKKSECPLFNLANRVRGTTRSAFKRKKLKKTNGTIEMLGCTWEQLRAHIQKQFTKGMNWKNMDQWHIDHIIPLASARNEAEMMRLAHFSNLQPLWAADNTRKRDTIVTCQPELTLNISQSLQ